MAAINRNVIYGLVSSASFVSSIYFLGISKLAKGKAPEFAQNYSNFVYVLIGLTWLATLLLHNCPCPAHIVALLERFGFIFKSYIVIFEIHLVNGPEVPIPTSLIFGKSKLAKYRAPEFAQNYTNYVYVPVGLTGLATLLRHNYPYPNNITALIGRSNFAKDKAPEFAQNYPNYVSEPKGRLKLAKDKGTIVCTKLFELCVRTYRINRIGDFVIAQLPLSGKHHCLPRKVDGLEVPIPTSRHLCLFRSFVQEQHVNIAGLLEPRVSGRRADKVDGPEVLILISPHLCLFRSFFRGQRVNIAGLFEPRISGYRADKVDGPEVPIPTSTHLFQFCSFVREQHVNIAGLLEPQISGRRADTVITSLDFSNSFRVEAALAFKIFLNFRDHHNVANHRDVAPPPDDVAPPRDVAPPPNDVAPPRDVAPPPNDMALCWDRIYTTKMWPSGGEATDVAHPDDVAPLPDLVADVAPPGDVALHLKQFPDMAPPP
ncbi:hypothetical protein V6N13_098401 [Hibiscus sabdariffa]